MGQQKTKKIEKEEPIKEEVKKPAEKIEEKKPEVKPAAKPKKAKAPRVRGQKWTAAKEKIGQKDYVIEEAIELAKSTNNAKFDASVEAHINFQLAKKSKEPIRGMVKLPHGTGKKLNVAIADDKLIEEITKTKKTPFDVLLAKTEDLAKLTKIAKILGPKGLMPSEKSGTLTADPKKTLEELNKGKISYKTDQFGILHQILGKISWDDKKLVENYQTMLSVLPKNQIKSIYLCASMGPSIEIELPRS